MVIAVSILGSTGSIGRQTLDVISQHPDQFKVVGLAAHSNTDVLFEQCQTYRPQQVVCVDPQAAASLRSRLQQAGLSIEVAHGQGALIDLAADVASDVVVAAVVGAVGLPSTFAAAKAGKRILLANKEALIMAGALLMNAVRDYGATLLPIDSEHNALFQCMPPNYLPGSDAPVGVEGLVLTASGGPFLHTPLTELTDITPVQAVAHPTWSMGAKISVDSATMMNKGLEVIEAHWLFVMAAEQIEVVIHPQSIIHSLLRYKDGSVLAQCGVPDMRTPIAHCLAWPGRIATTVERLNLLEVGRFDFIEPDYQRFPCLKYAYQALQAGPVASIVLNTANEMAVDAFLKGIISYLEIPRVIEQALSGADFAAPNSLADVLAIEQSIREQQMMLAL